MVVTKEFLAHPLPGEEVVVTGISGRFPESDNVEHFFENLYNKVEMVTDDDRRWKFTNPEIPHRLGKINHIDKMDAGAFGMHQLETMHADAITRVILERVYEAILDSGYNLNQVCGSKTGVFIGCSITENEASIVFRKLLSPNFMILGTIKSLLPHIISSKFGFEGPSVSIDSACSSVMCAFERAYTAIRKGLCDNAIVGGVNVCLNSLVSLQFNRLGVLSSDGCCKVFDEKADGYARSETIGVVFLQKAKNARRIYGEVVHIKVNSSGYNNQGLNFPSGFMQAMLIKETYRDCNLDETNIDYLEAHGTGTIVGDPVEMNAMDECYCKNRTTPLIIGSVKSNVGHGECASGINSLVKVLLMMDRGLILPNINYDTPKKSITGLIEGRMTVPTDVMQWPENGSGISGINSSGFGGTNVHLILKRFNKMKVNNGVPSDNLPRLVCISGRTEQAVLNVINFVKSSTLDREHIRLLQEIFKNTGYEHLYRGYLIRSKEGTLAESVSFFEKKRNLCLLLTSGDNTLLSLGKELTNITIFLDCLKKIDSFLPVKISSMIAKENWSDSCDAFLCMVAIQIGIIDLFKKLKVHFDFIIGKSTGKIAAAYGNQKFSMKEAVLKTYQLVTNNFKTEQITKALSDIPSTISLEKNSNVTIVELGQKTINSERKDLEISTLESFLILLGRIYVWGYTIHCECLYPTVSWPVSSNTPTISPLIVWNHSDNWEFISAKDIIKSIHEKISLLSKEIDWSILPGHNIDGIVLMPATGYIYLAIDSYLKYNNMNLRESCVVLEQVKFYKATPIPVEIQDLVFQNVISKRTDRFEITLDNDPIVSGYIYSKPRELVPDLYFTQPIISGDATQDQTAGVYKELKLRGYNYSGAFRGIHHSDLNGTVNWIKTETNYITFMDNMLQTLLLNQDTRNLYVPTCISRLVLDVSTHDDFIRSNEVDGTLPVYSSKDANAVSCGGIQIQGLQPTQISRRKKHKDAVLEKYVFVPFETTLSSEEAVRVILQIVLENTMNFKIKIVEVHDDNTQTLLTPLVQQAEQDVPSLNCEITVLTKFDVTLQNVTVVDSSLNHMNECGLIILTSAAEQNQIHWATSALKNNGFIISRQKNLKTQLIPDLEVVSTLTTDNETLVLLKKSQQHLENEIKVVISGSNFDWIPRIQQLLKERQKILLVVENDENNGALGFFKCFRNEYDLIRCVIVMDSAVHINHEFFMTQVKKGLKINVLKNGQWGAYRHLPIPELPLIKTKHASCYIKQIGNLSSLRWIERSLSDRAPNEIEVYYSALNFKDVALAAGLITSDTFTSDRLEQINCCKQGMEFAGKDSRGRRVMGISILGGSLSDRVNVDFDKIWEIPDDWSLQEAATVPVCYTTVIVALKTARIKQGDSILIHAGSGGVGQAALHIATWYKCTIFTTVGTEEKRQFIRTYFPHVPNSHVGNSRDTSFEQMIFKQTRGRGVDIILSSLTDDKLEASLRCLAPRGRLVDISKSIMLKNIDMTVTSLTEGRMYCSVMLDMLIRTTSAIQKKICGELDWFIEKKIVKPLHYSVFNKDEVETAYRFMANGKHVGKLLFCVREEDKAAINFCCEQRFTCDSRSTYIIVGGLGGVGLELADWLVIRGARKLVLVSRTGKTSDYAKYRLKIWTSYEATVKIVTHDVTTQFGCLALIYEASKLGEIAAIFNLALVLKDDLFENQNEENFRTVFSCKATATHYLDLVSRDHCPNLKHFVVFSSIVCGRGNVGQTPYGMANSIMERICEKRKDEGYPALAIQWAAIGEVGVLAEMQDRELDILGTSPQRIQSCLNALDTFLNQNEVIVSSTVVANKKQSGGTDVMDVIKDILGITDLKTVSQHMTLPELGMDSMTGLEIKLTLERDYDIHLDANDIRNMTFNKLKELMEDKNTRNNSTTSDIKTFKFYTSEASEGDANIPITKLGSLISDEDTAPTVFFFPGVEGTTKAMEYLANNLEAYVYGLQYVYNTPECDTVEYLAQNLQTFVPSDKSFKIVAYSYGCLVATELASILEARGQKGVLILLDGSQEMFKEVMKKSIGDLESVPLLETMVLTNLMEFYMTTEEIAKHQENLIKCVTLDERIEYVVNVLPKTVPYSKEYQRQFSFKLCSRIRSVVTYRPNHKKIQSPVFLFKPRDAYLENFADDYLIQELCEQMEVDVVEDSNHTTILRSPTLAQKINYILKQQTH